jgi:hypothetical protein
MDIFIKYFNRPFYLDRCIQSVFQDVVRDFCVTVLRDGTRVKYLDVQYRDWMTWAEKFKNQYKNLGAETE